LAFGVRTDHGDVNLMIFLRPAAVPGGISAGIPGGVVSGVIGGVPGGIAGGVPGMLGEAGSTTAVAAQLPPPANGVMRIRVGGNVEANNLIKKVTPLYPPLAK
jgi:hypothetical protein